MTHFSLCSLVGVLTLLLFSLIGVLTLLLLWQQSSYKTFNIIRNIFYFDSIKVKNHFRDKIKTCKTLLFYVFFQNVFNCKDALRSLLSDPLTFLIHHCNRACHINSKLNNEMDDWRNFREIMCKYYQVKLIYIFYGKMFVLKQLAEMKVIDHLNITNA